MAIKHSVALGESLLEIAKYYGFGSVDPLVNHPDNQALLSERDVQPGDVLTIPEGKQGESSHGTGRGHDIVVQVVPKRFRIRLCSALYKENPHFPGDFAKRSAERWHAYGSSRPVIEIEATIDIGLMSGTPAASMPSGGTSNRKTGIFETVALGDGRWFVDIHPIPSELSPGPAYADPNGDHGLGHYTSQSGKKSGKPLKPPPNNPYYELEFRPLELEVNVSAGVIVDAHITTPPAATRPHHAVLYWLNCENVPDDTQVLDVDWKPDFLRRICPVIRPMQRARKREIDIIEFHHTAGHNIGKALYGFLAKGEDSGAHFLIDLDGHVVRIADDRYYTQHGGGNSNARVPSWNNKGFVNDRAIGIEHVHTAPSLSAETAYLDVHKYTDAQYEASIGLIRSLIKAYGVKLNNIIGHQDAVVKAACPGWVVDWPRLERAGVALGPASLSPAELELMFGGFFAGAVGRARRLPLASREKLVKVDGQTTVMVVDNKGDTIADGLDGHPIRELRQALLNIGYSPDLSVRDEKDNVHNKTPVGEFGKTLGFALSQFIRHYCTESRLRIDLRLAYRDAPAIWNGLFVDFELAKLVRAVEKAALLLP